ncbi:DUF4062 domain-containing protein [Desulfoluna spongiiphila]|uniref:DUF4062 domain-containing protein n=1 Tax=Desulfoluna spongiiphila TaxID=419481 RepID=A0A1G5G499_9BACT|nr:DUF4062 domain-containing protein [Desulfoluna spongiiphila]SCY46405.1 protein of unknown function [Desulfoluna spongiiphila]
MAVPKVFVSSTCFDLSEIRTQLKDFIRSFGFIPVLSEYGNVFYNPDLNTADSCLNEVENCQLFILAIGGRFGSKIEPDKNKSVTNAEYEAAVLAKIPIFTLIKSDVLSDHRVYEKNQNSEIKKSIAYPSIDDNCQEHAIDIFEFIDKIYTSPTNNACEGFNKFSDIESYLRKQWAAFFNNLLMKRKNEQSLQPISMQINELEAANQTLKNYLEELIRNTLNTDAQKIISNEKERNLKESERITKIRAVPFINFLTNQYNFSYDLVIQLIQKAQYFDDIIATLGVFSGDFEFNRTKSWWLNGGSSNPEQINIIRNTLELHSLSWKTPPPPPSMPLPAAPPQLGNASS